MTSENELYSTILDKISLTGDGTKLFYIAVTDGAGTELPPRIWMNGEDIELSMPVSDANAVLMGIDADGAAQTFEPVSYENGVAVYKLPALMQVFAVQTKQENPAEKPTGSADANSSTSDSATDGTSSSGGAVQTGASSVAVIVLIILAVSALITGAFVSKRRKGEQ